MNIDSKLVQMSDNLKSLQSQSKQVLKENEYLMFQNQKLTKQLELMGDVNSRIEMIEQLPKQVTQLRVCID
jgi:hypothetical protein